jgi:hypothetical protein
MGSGGRQSQEVAAAAGQLAGQAPERSGNLLHLETHGLFSRQKQDSKKSVSIYRYLFTRTPLQDFLKTLTDGRCFCFCFCFCRRRRRRCCRDAAAALQHPWGSQRTFFPILLLKICL